MMADYPRYGTYQAHDSAMEKLLGDDPLARYAFMQYQQDLYKPNSMLRATTAVSNINSRSDLIKADEGFRSTMLDISEKMASNSSALTPQNAALYTYMCQRGMSNLQKTKYKNGDQTHYMPYLQEQYLSALAQAKTLGISSADLHKRCFSTRCQNVGIEELNNFEVLDENMLNRVMYGFKEANRLDGKDKRRQQERFFEVVDAGLEETTMQPATEQQIDNLMGVLAAQYGNAKGEIDPELIKGDMNQFFNLVKETSGVQDREMALQIAGQLCARVYQKNQELQQNQNQEQEMSR